MTTIRKYISTKVDQEMETLLDKAIKFIYNSELDNIVTDEKIVAIDEYINWFRKYLKSVN